MRRLIAAVFMTFAGSAQVAFADGSHPAPTPWGVIGADARYAVEGKGDPWSDDGATVVARSVGADAAPFGGAIALLDATPLRGREVTLSADLVAAAGTSGGMLWLRADDGETKAVAFENSQGDPLASGDAASREVAIVVPEAATKLVFGTGLAATGRLEARHLRLRAREAPPESRVPPREVLDAAIDIVRQHALNAGKIDWETLSASLREKLRDTKQASAAHQPIRELLAALGDGHSFFSPPRDARRYATTGAPKLPPRVELLDSGVGYLRVPGYAGSSAPEAAAFADAMADEIDALAPRVKAGWVVDLRRNHGGNLWPMLAAMRALLGDGVIGKFRNAAGELDEWRAGDLVERKEKSRRDLGGAKVAVLLGNETASSGEAVAIAFHGRPSTRSFGEATMGLSSANAGFDLPDGSKIFLTTGVDVDRNGKVFGGKVEPDEVIGEAAGKDAVLEAANGWLKK